MGQRKPQWGLMINIKNKCKVLQLFHRTDYTDVITTADVWVSLGCELRKHHTDVFLESELGHKDPIIEFKWVTQLMREIEGI